MSKKESESILVWPLGGNNRIPKMNAEHSSVSSFDWQILPFPKGKTVDSPRLDENSSTPFLRACFQGKRRKSRSAWRKPEIDVESPLRLTHLLSCSAQTAPTNFLSFSKICKACPSANQHQNRVRIFRVFLSLLRKRSSQQAANIWVSRNNPSAAPTGVTHTFPNSRKLMKQWTTCLRSTLVSFTSWGKLFPCRRMERNISWKKQTKPFRATWWTTLMFSPGQSGLSSVCRQREMGNKD